MPTFRNPFTRKDSVRGSTPVDGRLAMAGLVTPAGDLGVTAGILSGLAVTGRSTAPTWAYSVSAGHAVTTRGASDGANLTGLDGATDTPTVSAAPATGSRWDLIWIRQRDVDNGDPDSDAVLGVTSGTSGGTPSKPFGSVPAGALVLAEAQVSAGASNTADALVTITAVAPRVAARGGIIPVASTTQQNLLTTAGSASNPVYTELAGTLFKSTGSGWVPLTSPLTAMTGPALAGTTPPAGTSLKKVIVNGTVNSGGAGRVAVAFGYTFPNGVVSCTPTLVNGNSVGAWINLYGPPSLTACTLQLMSGTASVPNAGMQFSLVVEGW